MAKSGFLSKIGGVHARVGAASNLMPISQDSGRERLELLDNFEELKLGWFWATDAKGRLIYLSHSAIETLGQSADEIIGKSLSDLFIPDKDSDPGKAERPLPFLLSARHSFADMPARVALPQQDEEIWWSISGKPQIGSDGTFLGYRGSAKDITFSRERERDTARLAQYDGLTGLTNRNHMEKRLTATLIAYKAAKRSCALMLLDLDRFKAVNDTLGHPAGDEVLKQVAQRLQKVIGSDCEIGRIGGDEFQILLPDIDDRGQLGDIATRLIQMIAQPYSVNGNRAIIGASVGIAIAPYDGLDAEDLVSSADLALYSSKSGGRGQFRFYSSELKEGAQLRKQIEEDLRDAIPQDQLEMHYQPLIQAGSNIVKGFEALMRWNNPESGWISPGIFIPIAEETSVINELGEWALRRACSDAAEWPGDLTVAVNVSAVQFANEDFVQVVKNALESSGLDPARLELEITESVFMADPHATKRMFARLKKLGVRLALDDFGTGYSSLSYLSQAPFDKLKIDQSFVRGATENGSNNAAIIDAVVSLANALGMITVAEGVEAKDELDLVVNRGATLIQGYVFAKALPHNEVLQRLEEGRLEYDIVGPARHRSERKTVFRRVGVIHEDHRYEAVLRNLSSSGAMIEGILNVPKETDLVLDLGEGQLVVAKVRRSKEATQGLEFETTLVSDGADGLCTRHRVSPYALAAAGMPLQALPTGYYPLVGNEGDHGTKSRPKFMEVTTSKAAWNTD